MNGKPYMNAGSKQAYVVFQGAETAIRGILEVASKSMPRSVSGDIKRALFFLRRGRETWRDSVDQKSIDSVMRIAADSNLGLVNNRTKQLDKEMYEKYLFGKEHVTNAAEVTMEAKCRTCDGACRTECPLYEFYKHFDVAPWDPSHPHCEFAGAGVTV